MLCHLCRSGSGLLALQSNPNFVWILYILYSLPPYTTLPANISSVSISTQPCEFCQTLPILRILPNSCAERQIQFASHNPPKQLPDPASKGFTTEQKTFENKANHFVVSSCFKVMSNCGGSCLVDLKLALAQTNLPLSRRTAGTHWAVTVTFQLMKISRYPKQETSRTRVSHQQTVLFCGLAWN